MDVIFANGTKANFENMLYEAARKALADMIAPGATTEKPEKIDPNRIYGLNTPEVHRIFGVENLSRPAPVIVKRLRNAGIDVNTRQKTGSTVTGYQLINYFDRLKCKPYLSKAL